jgi:hypothetical protein
VSAGWQDANRVVGLSLCGMKLLQPHSGEVGDPHFGVPRVRGGRDHNNSRLQPPPPRDESFFFPPSSSLHESLDKKLPVIIIPRGLADLRLGPFPSLLPFLILALRF